MLPKEAGMQATLLGHIHLSSDIPAACFSVELEGRRSQQSPAPSLCGFNSQRRAGNAEFLECREGHSIPMPIFQWMKPYTCFPSFPRHSTCHKMKAQGYLIQGSYKCITFKIRRDHYIICPHLLYLTGRHPPTLRLNQIIWV